MQTKISKKGAFLFNKNVLLIVSAVLIMGLFVYFGFFATGSILFGAGELQCSSFGNTLGCSVLGKASSPSIDGKYHFVVTKPSATSERNALALNFIENVGYGNNENNGYVYCNPSKSGYSGCIQNELLNAQLGKQLIIIEGTYEKDGLKSFKIYGLCDELGFAGCWANVPNDIKEVSTDLKVNPEKITIYVKAGGYSEVDFINPTTTEEKIVQQIIIQENIQATSENPITSSVSQKPFSLGEWFSNLFNTIKGWFYT